MQPKHWVTLRFRKCSHLTADWVLGETTMMTMSHVGCRSIQFQYMPIRISGGLTTGIRQRFETEHLMLLNLMSVVSTLYHHSMPLDPNETYFSCSTSKISFRTPFFVSPRYKLALQNPPLSICKRDNRTRPLYATQLCTNSTSLLTMSTISLGTAYLQIHSRDTIRLFFCTVRCCVHCKEL